MEAAAAASKAAAAKRNVAGELKVGNAFLAQLSSPADQVPEQELHWQKQGVEQGVERAEEDQRSTFGNPKPTPESTPQPIPNRNPAPNPNPNPNPDPDPDTNPNQTAKCPASSFSRTLTEHRAKHAETFYIRSGTEMERRGVDGLVEVGTGLPANASTAARTHTRR